ncbi:N-acetylglucosamine kinase-like BadF-type ATPase [Kribbella voronezhensis]|uniref:N-acetylglucosamine kinase-like BadF-type ATPase n=1 Tax=Kribbella voronezhensis TaxID=2512212 RepID=A0A4R7TCB8_9ACTN|nr:BadF/BadG/BcrA/BcrD ATPase family protein [Kribbella voronezhensis]TDU89731.1 N-acetylglucosamine kinase-like BadF-type ATPase [Kribbella voronezhensis]
MIRLAVDGGQSALRLRVVDDGRTGTGPGYTHSSSVQGMLDAIRTAADDAGVTEPAEVVALGLTGFPPDPPAARLLAAGIAKALAAKEVRLTQDMVTAHAGALPGGYGVVVAAGTGLVCLAVDRDGSWHKIDGHGYLFGDAGSAFAIGRAGLVAVQRARDGRGPETLLAETSLDPVSLYPSPTLVDDVARFAPAVLRCAAEGDAVARDIVVRAAGDVAETIATGVRLTAGTGQVPVACIGGLFRGSGEQLLGPLRDALPPRADLVAAAGSCLDGAERLATGPPGPYAGLIVTYRS